MNTFRWPGGHQAFAGTAARTSAMAPQRLLASPAMLLSDYQRLSRRTATYPGAGDNIVYPTLGLSGEAGEVAEKVKKMLRDDGGVMTGERLQALAGELGDVLWYVAQVATEAGLDLEAVAQANLDKLLSRRARGMLSGSGDTR
jgi:NTP pyrophosphatase (non-canonical NTP hydrolase)